MFKTIDDLGNIHCERCDKILEIGMHPFCPHDKSGAAIQRDEIPGGIICENYGPHPIRFDSHSERRRYMEAHGLREKEKFSPMPGTDKDPAGIPNPAGYMDPYTLENARILISRNGQKTTSDETTGVLVNQTVEVVEDLERIRRATTESS